MAVCEQCSIQFEESTDAVGEVTSLRVLCPACAEERRRQKLAARAAQTAATPAAGQPAPRPVAPPPAATPPASARPATPAAPPAARPSAPAGTPAPKPAAPAARPAAPAVKPAAPAARPAPPAATPRPASPNSAPPATRSRSPSRAAEPARPVRTAVRRSSTANRSEFIVESGDRKKPVLDKATKIGLIAAAVLFVTAGVVLYLVKGQKTAEKNAMEARAAAVGKFMDEIRGLDLKTEADAEKVRPLAEDNTDLWLGTDRATEVNSLIAKAEGFLLANLEKKDFDARLIGIEAKLSNASAMEAKDLADTRRSLDAMAVAAKGFGDDFEARVKTARGTASRAYVMRLIADAETFLVENPGQQRPALTKFALAEEELRLQLADGAGRNDTEVRTALEPLYLKVIEVSDRLSQEVFTDAYVESTQWRDLLSSGEAARWIGSKSSGFDWKIENGVMRLQGPTPDARGQASISIGDDERWRDFVLEIAFVVKAGSPNLYFRAPKNLDHRVKNVLLEPNPDPDMGGGLQLDKPYELRITFIGSRFVVVSNDEEAIQNQTMTSGANESRRGAFAMAIPKGAQFEISKLRIKVLR